MDNAQDIVWQITMCDSDPQDLDLASRIELNWHKVFLQMLHEILGQILLGSPV